MKSSNKNLSLEGLRGIASLIVAISHFAFVFSPILASQFNPIEGARFLYPLERWLHYPPLSLIFSGEAAVCVFFVMSGYVLTTKYFSTGGIEVLQRGAAKRYIRLVLPSFASVMLAWMLWRTGGIIAAQSAPLGVAGWVPTWYVGPYPFFGAIFNGLVSAPLFGHTVLNSPLWTIQVELIGSVLLFAMFAALGRNPLWLCVWFLFFADVLSGYLPNVLFYVAFFAGALLNPAREWLRSHQIVSACLICLGLIGVAYNLNPVFDFMRAIPLPNLQPYGPNFGSNIRLLWNSLGAFALVAGVIGSNGVGAVLSSRIPVFLGKISFSLYVIHVPLVMSVGLHAAKFGQQHGMSYGESVLFSFVVYLLVVLSLATFFHRYIDAPSIRLADFVANRRWRKTKISPNYQQTGA